MGSNRYIGVQELWRRCRTCAHRYVHEVCILILAMDQMVVMPRLSKVVVGSKKVFLIWQPGDQLVLISRCNIRSSAHLPGVGIVQDAEPTNRVSMGIRVSVAQDKSFPEMRPALWAHCSHPLQNPSIRSSGPCNRRETSSNYTYSILNQRLGFKLCFYRRNLVKVKLIRIVPSHV